MGVYIASKIKSYISTCIPSNLCGPVKKILVSTAQVTEMNLLLAIYVVAINLYIYIYIFSLFFSSKFYPTGDETIYMFFKIE